MKRRYLLEQWNDYASHALPPHTQPEVRAAMGRAFMAGAVSTWAVIMGNLEPTPRTTIQDMQMMKALQAEFDDYGEQAKTGTV